MTKKEINKIKNKVKNEVVKMNDEQIERYYNDILNRCYSQNKSNSFNLYKKEYLQIIRDRKRKKLFQKPLITYTM